MSIILTLTGLPGTGKTSIARELIKNPVFEMLPSNTTRPPRDSDLENEYRFLTFENFKRLEKEGKFLAAFNIHENWYGTFRSDIERTTADPFSPIIKIAILNPDGVQKFRDFLGKAAMRMYSVYIRYPGRETVIRRMRERGETLESAQQRLKTSRGWGKQIFAMGGFHIVENPDNPEKDVSRLAKKIHEEAERRQRRVA